MPKESDCLQFEGYMELLQDLVKRKGEDKTYKKIMLTSEDKKMIEARLAFSSKNDTFPFDFIINEDDAGQGTGLPGAFKADTADHIMISSLVSMKMQLQTDIMAVNSCSNFHKLLIDLAMHGCGAHSYFEEYKSNPNPKFQLKCLWG